METIKELLMCKREIKDGSLSPEKQLLFAMKKKFN